MFFKDISFANYQQNNDVYWSDFWQKWRNENYSA